MPVPVEFPSDTPRLGLPLLFTAQAQKEIFHNEALARLDGLLHAVIEGAVQMPPADPADGQSWLVADGAQAEWGGRDGAVAMRQSGQWLYLKPFDGLRVFDRSTEQFALFSGTWQKASTIEEPSGGLMVDSEARAAIGALLSALRASGILPPAGRQ